MEDSPQFDTELYIINKKMNMYLFKIGVIRNYYRKKYDFNFLHLLWQRHSLNLTNAVTDTLPIFFYFCFFFTEWCSRLFIVHN